ncbi:hypothetical protein [Paenibacillus mucilaginosus]|uniref:Uncharacterized protein n=1 Tax=Paenibacillus mucilaginosus (strain KNP414) TaxID=1036673 RepID=F8FP03_PAEMK|nr:hypothetical protein [Paenibacillus mucilaginosus]AEI45782.1 hypothetical protein KNP414_07272 [Paenibacillus mucilaginosus KNP414]MCG7215034.1 hypothetical protein [Paenibacillus mucilaginosus]WDM27157.1 hypothetical protein KCX80_32980 [Paenibacillus mucilaginosus]
MSKLEEGHKQIVEILGEGRLRLELDPEEGRLRLRDGESGEWRELPADSAAAAAAPHEETEPAGRWQWIPVFLVIFLAAAAAMYWITPQP